jgi:hypothetical protein
VFSQFWGNFSLVERKIYSSKKIVFFQVLCKYFDFGLNLSGFIAIFSISKTPKS